MACHAGFAGEEIDMSAREWLHQGNWIVSLGVLPLCLIIAGCGSGGSGGGTSLPSNLKLTLSSASVVALQDGTPAPVTVTIQRPSGDTSAATLSTTSLPAGLQAQITFPGSGSSGSVAFTALGTTSAGTYPITIQASDASATGSAQLQINVAIVATVGASINANAGVNGSLKNFMSTSFEPTYDNQDFFFNHPGDTTPLNNLQSQHIRIQVVCHGCLSGSPWISNSSPQQASDWNFSQLDTTVQPILTVTDHSPEFQIASAPNFLNDSSANFIFNTANVNLFAQYCANLVRYYNKGGFTWGGQTFVSPSYPQQHITWWGIFNEYNINGLSAEQYLQLYNTVVPAMLAVDPTIKFSALELADEDILVNELRGDLSTFVAGVTAPVGIASTHFYSVFDQTQADVQVFRSVPTFLSHVAYIYQELRSQPSLANVPVWVTENNVNADWDNNGMSAINPGQVFVRDQRGTSAFFAAWRPYVFSQLGQAGVQGTYHWMFGSDAQFGEVNDSSAVPYLSYWVDYYLERYFPFCESGAMPNCITAPPSILNLASTEPVDAQTVEVLATRNADNSVVVMVADHAVNAPSDNNGPGAPRTVVIDVSALGQFTSGTQLTIDANTNPANGPAAASITPAARMTLNLGGYGVTFVTLKP
jgi:hypothetical protein